MAIRMVLQMSVPLALIYFFFGGRLIGFFLRAGGDNAKVVAEGALFLRILAFFYLPACLKNVTDGVLRGSGAMISFMISTFADLILRVALAYLFVRGLSLGSVGIWSAWPLGWLIGMSISMFYYKKGDWEFSRI